MSWILLAMVLGAGAWVLLRAWLRQRQAAAARLYARHLAEAEAIHREAEEAALQETRRLADKATAEAAAAALAARIEAERVARAEARQRQHEAEIAATEAASAARAARIETERLAQVQALQRQREAEEVARRETQRLAERAASEAAAVAEAARVEVELIAKAEALRRQREAEEEAHRDAQRRADKAAAEAVARAEAEQRAAAKAQRVVAERVEVASQHAAAPTSAARQGKLKPSETLVMVADDSKVVRVKINRLLAQHGYRVVLAESGEDAVVKLRAEMPHVLITDVEMLGMDGFELTRMLRASEHTAHLPIIMITSADNRKDAAASAGVSALLGKPYPEDELISCIERLRDAAAAKVAH